MGGGGGSTPQPAPFVPNNIGQVSDQALQADIQGYNLADADLAQRFPGLVAGRTQQIDTAYKNLTGPLDPTVQNNFTTQGIERGLSSFGGGNPNASISKGSAGENAVAVSLANNVQQKQDYDRSNFEGLLGYNPQRSFGLTGADVTNMNIANTAGQNAYNQQKYLGQVGASNANAAAGAQQNQAIMGTVVSLASAALIAY